MSQNTKIKIKSAALNLFSKYGFAGTSMRHIAKEVGVRESAIYNHFSSKEELLGEILEEYNPWNSGIHLLTDELMNSLDNPRKFLFMFSEKLLNYWNGDYEKKMLRLIVFEEFRASSETKSYLSRVMSSLQELWVIIFNEMKKLNIINNIDSEILSQEFVSSLFFIRIELLSMEDKQDTADANERLKQHIDFFWNAVTTG
jgi:AcrR family transcriptional regulator